MKDVSKVTDWGGSGEGLNITIECEFLSVAGKGSGPLIMISDLLHLAFSAASFTVEGKSCSDWGSLGGAGPGKCTIS